MPKNESVFELGLAMAGAISAGAYSAGVIDFLFQALDEWERLKREAPDTVPNHAVCIRAISGASAGSLTGALAAVAAAGGLRRTAFATPRGEGQAFECVFPSLHAAWVKKPDMALATGRDDLLAIDDLETDEPPASLLNAALLNKIAEQVVRLPEQPPAGAAHAPAYGRSTLPYVAERLHLYFSLSNVRGVPYTISFDPPQNRVGHYMMSHGDRAHFVLRNIGSRAGENLWLQTDQGNEIDVRTLPKGEAGALGAWQGYVQAALGSSAFPLGLAARKIESDTLQYENRHWPSVRLGKHSVGPDWTTPRTRTEKHPYNFMCLDGGLIDNEPFGYAHQAILLPGETSNPQGENEASRAVVMIDPFPDRPAFPSDEEADDGSLLTIVRSLLPVLKNQARFKPAELAGALDEQRFSRWMIAPSRSGQKYTIATGLLGGFGGFVAEAFRRHDYQLGRRNCQRFLKEQFVVGDRNPLVWDKAAGEPKWPEVAFDNDDFRKKDKESGKYYCSIIPVVGDAKPEVVAEPWPLIGPGRVAEIERRIAIRAGKLAAKLLIFKSLSPVLNWALRLAWKWRGEGSLLKFVSRTIEADLVRRDQVDGVQLLSANARAVLAELTAPGFDFRIVGDKTRGICRTSGLEAAPVREALGELQNARPGLVWSGPFADQECWALAKYRPSWWERNNPLGGELSIG